MSLGTKLVKITRCTVGAFTAPACEFECEQETLLDNVTLWTLQWGKPLSFGDVVEHDNDEAWLCVPRGEADIMSRVSPDLGFKKVKHARSK